MPTARISVTVQSFAGLPEAGVQLTEATPDVVNGNRFSNAARDCVFVARNNGGVTYTATFIYSRRGATVTQAAVSIPAGKTRVFGPFASEMGDHPADDAADGDVYVTVSNVAVQLSVLRLPMVPSV